MNKIAGTFLILPEEKSCLILISRALFSGTDLYIPASQKGELDKSVKNGVNKDEQGKDEQVWKRTNFEFTNKLKKFGDVETSVIHKKIESTIPFKKVYTFQPDTKAKQIEDEIRKDVSNVSEFTIRIQEDGIYKFGVKLREFDKKMYDSLIYSKSTIDELFIEQVLPNFIDKLKHWCKKLKSIIIIGFFINICGSICSITGKTIFDFIYYTKKTLYGVIHAVSKINS